MAQSFSEIKKNVVLETQKYVETNYNAVINIINQIIKDEVNEYLFKNGDCHNITILIKTEHHLLKQFKFSDHLIQKIIYEYKQKGWRVDRKFQEMLFYYSETN